MIDKERPKYILGEDIDLYETEIVDNQGQRLTNERASQIANEVIQRLSGGPK